MFNIKAKIKNYVMWLVSAEKSAPRLALTVCIGIFIALSPFLFFHTIMIIGACWFLRLNFVLVYGVAHVINNPWTMIAIYATDHWIGRRILLWWGASNLSAANPFWLQYINNYLHDCGLYAGFSLWSFLLGGSLLAVGFSVMLYPVLKRFFEYWLQSGAHGETTR